MEMKVEKRKGNPRRKWHERWPYDVTSQFRKVEPDLVFIGGQMPLDDQGRVVGIGDIREQTRFALTNFTECVEQAGGSINDLVEIESFHTDVRHIPIVLEVAREFFVNNKPTWNAVGVSGLYKPEVDICFKGMAVLNAEIKDINPGWGWYDQPPWDVAVPCKVVNDLVIVGHSCAMDEKGQVEAPGDVLGQNRRILDKIIECVEEAGGTRENIIDLLGYTRDRRALLWQTKAIWDAMVSDPKNGAKLVEETNYTAIAMTGFFNPEILSTMRAYAVLGAEEKIPLGNWVGWKRFYPADTVCGAIKVGRYLFFSGQVLFDPLFFEPTLEPDMPSIKRQARYALSEYVRILGTVGASMDDVVWIQPFTSTWCMDPVLEVAHEFFHNEKPAWTAAGNTGLFLPTHLCEIYGMAVVGDIDYHGKNEN
jgi:enamine deaminase RidA (YjgF/YER057c/UK114 family)